jgi:hypothetical protein
MFLLFVHAELILHLIFMFWLMKSLRKSILEGCSIALLCNYYRFDIKGGNFRFFTFFFFIQFNAVFFFFFFFYKMSTLMCYWWTIKKFGHFNMRLKWNFAYVEGIWIFFIHFDEVFLFWIYWVGSVSTDFLHLLWFRR